MRSIKWHIVATLVCVLGAACSQRRSQPPHQEELLKPIPNNQLVNATEMQSERLAQLRQLPTTQSLSLVRLNQNALTGSEFTISIPDQKSFTLLRTRQEVRSKQDLTWIGKLQGEPRSSVTLIVRNGDVTGSITSAAGLFRIVPIGDGVHAVVKVDVGKFPPDDPPESGRPRE